MKSYVIQPECLHIPAVIAEDLGQLLDVMHIKVTIVDIDDNAPVFDRSHFTGSVAENSAGGTSVITNFQILLSHNRYSIVYHSQ